MKYEDMTDDEQAAASGAVADFLTTNGYNSLEAAMESLNLPVQQVWNQIMEEAGLRECEMPSWIQVE